MTEKDRLHVRARSVAVVVHPATNSTRETNMESISGVEREIDKVLSKFTGINEHADRVLQDLSRSIESLKNELDAGKLQIVTQVTAHI